MNKLKIILPYIGILCLSLMVVYFLYPKIHPFAGIPSHMNQDLAETASDRLTRYLDFRSQGYFKIIKLQQRKELLEYLQSIHGLQEAVRTARKDAAVYYYDVSWEKEWSFRFSTDSMKADVVISNLHMAFDLQGHLLEISRSASDSASKRIVVRSEAFQILKTFLSEFSAYRDVREDSSALPRIKNGNFTGRPIEREFQPRSGTEHEFAAQCSISSLGIPVWLHATVSGNQVVLLHIYFDLPQKDASEKIEMIFEVAGILILLLIGIVAFVITIQRYRAYELGFRVALVLGISAGVINAFGGFLSLPDQTGWQLLPVLLFVPFFYGLGIIIMWLVAETNGRGIWPDRFTGFDLLVNGHLLHSRLGVYLIKGITYGGVAFAVYLSILYFISGVPGIVFTIGNSDALQFLDSGIPALKLLADKSATMLYVAAIMIVLQISVLKKYLRPELLVYILGALLYGIVMGMTIRPIAIGIALHSLIAIVFIMSFVRTDSLSAYFAAFTFALLNNGTSFLFIGQTLLSGYLFFALLGLVLMYSVIACITRDSVEDLTEITPVFVRYINERQRLQRELEIARDVQMSFLPAGMPQFNGLDIAARCLPALEVGGDYYDFVELDDNRIAVTIGDVSGKGAQAAFYMTLTKGFLQAVARDVPSAAEVMKRLNRLFYENARRNTFISLVYGIFDMNRNMLHLARAGHDLVILFEAESRQVRHLRSAGLALGLERGIKFDELIEELHIPFSKGDTFIFYTDGLTEARNREGDDYGLERLENNVREYGDESAEELLNRVFESVRAFCGRAPRHDDLSAVVVKISG